MTLRENKKIPTVDYYISYYSGVFICTCVQVFFKHTAVVVVCFFLGTCGGSGCSGRGNGQFSCCTKNIDEAGQLCSETGAAPCIVDGEFLTRQVAMFFAYYVVFLVHTSRIGGGILSLCQEDRTAVGDATNSQSIP